MAKYAIKIRTRYRNDQTSRELALPAIYTESGLLISHLRYLADNSYKSGSWLDRSVFAVMLLIRYINANQSVFEDATSLLRSFSQCLSLGTVNPSTLEDESRLYWSPRSSEDANTLLGHITTYTDWLSDQPEYDQQRINKFRKATSVEQRLNWCAYYHKHARVFLNHLYLPNSPTSSLNHVRQVQTHQRASIQVATTKRFPTSEIRRLLDRGMVKPKAGVDQEGKCIPDYKNQAITLLMHYGGVRKSEVFHLYLNDIHVDRQRSEAIVRIFHPSEGISPDSRYGNRREYLMREFGLKPRTDYAKSERLHSGWKGPLLTDKRKFFQVQFFPPEKAAEFLLVWRDYLLHQRVEPSSLSDHPYAFTNSKGQPETLKNFQRQHQNAVRRIGLEHSKSIGTTEHGHRHAYGYRLANHGFSQVEVQKAMHHKSKRPVTPS
ncbi:gamma-mobile-trio recombinase GmtY [Hahella ganghwensis]|uniref:gamma-mobile-trio recombinase GmtY n=1 Tax=Hahella ganghwensis TaxID=286420 RepID=UPI0003A512E1|nr:gamma-mobile-trio recombinase GmtY [Hahella ganghwensis]